MSTVREIAAAHRRVPDPLIEVYKQGIDRSLIRRNLRRSVTERFEAAIALQRFAEELRRAGSEARHKKP